MKKPILWAAALLLVAAACGGSDATSADGIATLSGVADDEVAANPLADAEGEEQDAEAALLEFTACLRENGVDIEDPTVGPDGEIGLVFRAGSSPTDEGFDREAARAAREACSDLLEGAALGFGRLDQTEIEDNLYAYAECMRDSGYDMDDPDFSGFGRGGDGPGEEGEVSAVVIGPFGEIDPDDPVFIAASEACADILSGFGPGGGFGRPGGGAGGGAGRGGNG